MRAVEAGIRRPLGRVRELVRAGIALAGVPVVAPHEVVDTPAGAAAEPHEGSAQVGVVGLVDVVDGLAEIPVAARGVDALRADGDRPVQAGSLAQVERLVGRRVGERGLRLLGAGEIERVLGHRRRTGRAVRERDRPDLIVHVAQHLRDVADHPPGVGDDGVAVALSDAKPEAVRLALVVGHAVDHPVEPHAGRGRAGGGRSGPCRRPSTGCCPTRPRTARTARSRARSPDATACPDGGRRARPRAGSGRPPRCWRRIRASRAAPARAGGEAPGTAAPLAPRARTRARRSRCSSTRTACPAPTPSRRPPARRRARATTARGRFPSGAPSGASADAAA